MSFLNILNFSLRLISAKKTRNFLVSFSVLIGTMVLFLFFVFSEGIQDFLLRPIRETTSPETLIVSNDYFSLGFLDINQGKTLDQEAIDEIKTFPEVKNVARVLTLDYPSSLKVWMFGFTFETDTPVYAVDKEIFGLDQPDEFKEFIRGEDEIMVPIAVSPYIIDVFNSSLAETVKEIPHLKAENLQDKRFQLIFGKSTVFTLGDTEPIYRSAQIKVISPRAPPLGVSIPIETAFDVSEKLGRKINENPSFSQAYIEANNVDEVKSLQEKITTMGLKAKTFGEVGEEILTLILSLRVTLLLTATLIIFVSLLSMFSLISVSVIEQKQTIGILNSIGAPKGTIFAIFITQGVILGAIGAFLGLFIGTFFSIVLDNFILSKIPDISIKPETFFPLSLNIFLWIFAVVILASFVATLFPARKSAKISPLEAIVN